MDTTITIYIIVAIILIFSPIVFVILAANSKRSENKNFLIYAFVIIAICVIGSLLIAYS